MRPSARFYIGIVLLLGIGSIATAEWHFPNHWEFVCVLAAAVFASGLKVSLPGIFGTLSVNYFFILAAGGTDARFASST